MDNRQVIATLNNLLAITKDGEPGFRTCAGGVTSLDLKIELEAAVNAETGFGDGNGPHAR
jgi:hypothetical protein